MKVKLLVPRSGPAGAFNVDDEIEVSDSEAKRMFAARHAVPISEVRTERAVKAVAAEKRG